MAAIQHPIICFPTPGIHELAVAGFSRVELAFHGHQYRSHFHHPATVSFPPDDAFAYHTRHRKIGFQRSVLTGIGQPDHGRCNRRIPVEIPQPSALPEIPYWRMLSLDVYQNGKFSRSSKTARRLRSPELMTSGHFVSNRMIQRPDFFSGEDWTFYLEGSISRYLPTPGTFRSIQFQSLQFLREDPIFATFNTRQTSSQLTTFRLRTSLPTNLSARLQWIRC